MSSSWRSRREAQYVHFELKPRTSRLEASADHPCQFIASWWRVKTSSRPHIILNRKFQSSYFEPPTADRDLCNRTVILLRSTSLLNHSTEMITVRWTILIGDCFISNLPVRGRGRFAANSIQIAARVRSSNASIQCWVLLACGQTFAFRSSTPL